MAVVNTGDAGVFFDQMQASSSATDLISAQLDPSQPQIEGLSTHTNPLLPDRHVSSQLPNFDSTQFDLSDDSHLRRLLDALLGAGGIGGLRRQQQLARMSSTLSGTHWLDLDGFWGKLFSLPRDPVSEALPVDADGAQFNAFSTLADANTWDDIAGRDGRYRSRIEQLAKGFAAGATYTGIYLAATAILNCDVEIVESWVFADAIAGVATQDPSGPKGGPGSGEGGLAQLDFVGVVTLSAAGVLHMKGAVLATASLTATGRLGSGNGQTYFAIMQQWGPTWGTMQYKSWITLNTPNTVPDPIDGPSPIDVLTTRMQAVERAASVGGIRSAVDVISPAPDASASTLNNERLPVGNRSEIIIIPGRAITVAEQWTLEHVLSALIPTHCMIATAVQSFDVQTPLIIRDLEADSNNWHVVSSVSERQSMDLGLTDLYPGSGQLDNARPGFSSYTGEKWCYNSRVASVSAYAMHADGSVQSAYDYDTIIFANGTSHDYAAQGAMADSQRTTMARAAADGVMTTSPYVAARGA